MKLARGIALVIALFFAAAAASAWILSDGTVLVEGDGPND